MDAPLPDKTLCKLASLFAHTIAPSPEIAHHLTKTRWLLLKGPGNLSEKQESKLADLLRYNLKSIRSYLLKGDSQLFWTYKSPYWDGWFFETKVDPNVKTKNRVV